MKMLLHRAAISAELPFVLDDLKSHAVVQFTDDDDLITNMGQAAAAEIEHFAQIALLTQTIRVTIFDPNREDGLHLPIGPVADNITPTVTADGVSFTGFDFLGGQRPYIRWQAAYFDLTLSRISIEYEAGFGGAASDIPPDLAQAIMDQAALLYDARSPIDTKRLTTSPRMARIAARYRGVLI